MGCALARLTDGPARAAGRRVTATRGRYGDDSCTGLLGQGSQAGVERLATECCLTAAVR